MNSDLPDLETQCPFCKGQKQFFDETIQDHNHDGFVPCPKCNGSGYIPTAAGTRILKLFRHNSRVTVNAELCVSTAA